MALCELAAILSGCLFASALLLYWRARLLHKAAFNALRLAGLTIEV
jgi:hypothetical protein